MASINATWATLYLGVNQSGLTTTFEGKTYGLTNTSSPDVQMIVAISRYGSNAFEPINTNSRFDFSFPGPDAKGNLNYQLPVRVRYVSTDTSLAPGIRTISQQAMFRTAFIALYGASCSVSVPKCDQGNSGSSSKLEHLHVKPFSFTVNGISCKLSVPAQVQLAKVNNASFQQIGSTIEAAAFQIGASCEKSYAAYKINYEMTDVTNPSNLTENLTLRNTPDQASGVKLQILDNGVPLKFGSHSLSNSGPGLFGEMSALGGSLTKTLTAQYVRTGDTVTPGKVNAGVTVTLSYE
ncbi:fimbrial protein [Pseudomonas sp. PDM03]|uniref:fimbrial protein n=1 Tax=Pseudomonas sp. PDM03 TaxID=2769266 RepID=UPI001782407B|nr:fimbrial protein [Pseudomonas sp. PDM03]MBD9585494.1 fimbrial protein [Pseudomonas sp. PDM03]